MQKIIERQALVPYSCEQLFALVNDVERYPDFLPYWKNVQILEKAEHHQRVQMDLSKGMLKQRLVTQNTEEYPHQIHMSLIEGPFSHFEATWRFKPLIAGGSEIRYTMAFEIGQGLLKSLLEPFFGALMETMMDSFLQEAKKRYA